MSSSSTVPTSRRLRPVVACRSRRCFCPEEASLDDARALLAEYRTGVKRARAAKSRPPPEDPLGLVAFRTPASPDTQRLIERFSLVLPELRQPIETLLVIEATSAKLAICFIQLPDRGSVTNRIERLATAVYNEHPALRLSRTKSSLFGRSRLRCRPTDVAIFEYLPGLSNRALQTISTRFTSTGPVRTGSSILGGHPFPRCRNCCGRSRMRRMGTVIRPCCLDKWLGSMITSELQTHGAN